MVGAEECCTETAGTDGAFVAIDFDAGTEGAGPAGNAVDGVVMAVGVGSPSDGPVGCPSDGTVGCPSDGPVGCPTAATLRCTTATTRAVTPGTVVAWLGAAGIPSDTTAATVAISDEFRTDLRLRARIHTAEKQVADGFELLPARATGNTRRQLQANSRF